MTMKTPPPLDLYSSERIKKKHGEEEQKRKEEAEAHLYTIIKVARDQDLAEQIGKDIFFDLVDHDKVRSFRIQNQTAFAVFKEEVAKEFGIPVELLRFWLWAKRQNNTYRPNRPLSSVEESQSVFHLSKTSKKTNNAELELFLEINLTPDLKPIPLPEKTNADILLFLKLYEPEKEELRYVRTLFVKAVGKPSIILPKLKEIAGFAPTDEIELFEEIYFEPNVLCEHIDKRLTFRGNQLEDGDIICYQKVLSNEDKKQYRFPDVPSFLEHVHKQLLQGKLDTLQQERDNIATERDQLRSQVEDILGERASWMVERLGLQAQLVAAQNASLTIERDTRRAQVETLQSDSHRLQAQVETLQSDSHRLQALVDSFDEQYQRELLRVGYYQSLARRYSPTGTITSYEEHARTCSPILMSQIRTPSVSEPVRRVT